MKTALAILLILAAVALVLALVGTAIKRPVQRAWAKRQAKNDQTTPWEIEEDPIGQAIQVQLVRPGEEPLRIGSPIPVRLPHWEYTELLEEVRVEAEDKQSTLNRKLLK